VCFLPLCSCVVCLCCVKFVFLCTKSRGWLGRTSLIGPVLRQMGHETELSQSDGPPLVGCPVASVLHVLQKRTSDATNSVKALEITHSTMVFPRRG